MPSMLRISQAALLLSLALSASAQDDDTNTNCSTLFAANATGSIPFRILYPHTDIDTPESQAANRDWIFTYELQENLNQLALPENLFYSFVQAPLVSVPEAKPAGYENRTLRACVYRGAQLNATWAGHPASGADTCNGILSQSCVDALQMAATIPYNEEVDCSMQLQLSDRVQEACGWIPEGEGAVSLQDSSCTVPSSRLPTPDDFITVNNDTTNRKDGRIERRDEGYDLLVRQIVPWVVSAAWSRAGDGAANAGDEGAGVICIAPGNITEGSQTPSLVAFPEGLSGASMVSAKWSWGVAVIVAGMVAFLL